LRITAIAQIGQFRNCPYLSNHEKEISWWGRAGLFDIKVESTLVSINPPLQTHVKSSISCVKHLSICCRGGFMLEILAEYNYLPIEPALPTNIG
jgi:hypothetical protein